MLSAKEALELYNNSLYTLQKYLDENFHSGIRQAAMDGKRRDFHNMGAEEHNLPELTPLEKKVLEELGKLGYTHHYMFYGDSYVPRGLADDDGNGTSYKNYGIVVKW
jgi:hypothetical protein